MDKNCIFCKIRDGKIPKEFTYQDKDIMVFPDINPIKPVHLLIIPKKHIRDFLDLNNLDLVQKLIAITKKMIKKNKLENKGYRVGINGGGAQAINHLHVHLLGPMGKKASF
jgi:histidine triad (HIT) family protein